MKNKVILAALIIICFGPFVLAQYLFNNSNSVHFKHNNHGQLLSQEQTLPKLNWTARKWHLSYVIQDACDENCQHDIYQLRQIHAALMKYHNRIQRIIIAPQALLTTQAELFKQYSDLQIIGLNPDELQQFAKLAEKNVAENFIIISDPLDNLVLKFASKDDKMGVLHDLKRLLSISTIG